MKKLKRNLASEKHNLDTVIKEGKNFWTLDNYKQEFVMSRSQSNVVERKEIIKEFSVKSRELIMDAVKKRNKLVELAKQFIRRGE